MTYYQAIIEMSKDKSKKFCRRGWKTYYPNLYICLSVCGVTKNGVRKEYENIYCNSGEAFIPGKDDVEGDDWEEYGFLSSSDKIKNLKFHELVIYMKKTQPKNSDAPAGKPASGG